VHQAPSHKNDVGPIAGPTVSPPTEIISFAEKNVIRGNNFRRIELIPTLVN